MHKVWSSATPLQFIENWTYMYNTDAERITKNKKKQHLPLKNPFLAEEGFCQW